MKKYNKLIRDRIPEIIERKGEKFVTHIANDEEYRKHVLEKLAEEVKEYSEESALDEMADILEVIYTIIEFKKINREELEDIRQKKKDDRGGFSKRIILDETN